MKPVSFLAVVVAAYNEEEGIAPTLSELRTVLNEPHLIVVDGRSSDRTLEIAKDMGVEIVKQEGVGKGNAIYEGFKQLGEAAEHIVLIDADFTYPAKHIKEMIYLLNTNPDVGMVLGDRFSNIFKHESERNQFYIGNRILGFAQRIFNGVKLNDPCSGLRIIRHELVNGWRPKSQGFDIEVELNHHVNNLGYEILEIPIKYRKRIGKKKLGFRHGLQIFRRIVIQRLSTNSN